MNKVNRETNRTRWMDHVNEWSKSGLTQVAYCRLHGLMLVTFYTWVARVKKASANPTTPLTLVPVVVQSAADHAELNSPIHLQHHSGWQLHLPAGTGASWLGKVLNGLT